MGFDEAWLGGGWYGRERDAATVWHWSRARCTILTFGAPRISLGFFTNFARIVGRGQRVAVLAGGRTISECFLADGAHRVQVACAGDIEIVIEVDTYQPNEYGLGADARTLGIALTSVEADGTSPTRSPAPSLDQNTIIEEPPLAMQIEVTTACHLSCVMCSRSKKTGGSKEHMTPDVVSRFMAAAERLQSVNILGNGEPWTHPEFLAMLQQLDAHGVITSITTTGDLINDARAEVLGSLKHLRDLVFSIDSPDPDTYFKLRGQPLHRALAGLERATRVIKDPMAIRVHTVVMRESLPTLNALPELLRRHSVHQLVLRGVNYTSKGARELVPEYTPEDCKLLATVRDEVEADGGVVNMLALPPHLLQVRDGLFKDEVSGLPPPAFKLPPGRVRPRRTRLCYDPWECAYIMRDGSVYPCEAYHLQAPIGSIAEQDFETIWRSEAYVAFRTNLLAEENVGCRNCERRAMGDHPYNYVAGAVEGLTISDIGTGMLVARNTGTQPWTREHPVHIGTAQARDRDSVLRHASWPLINRVGTHKEDLVRPGELAIFEFQLSVPDMWPQQPEHFQLVMESICWIPGTQLVFAPGAQSTHTASTALRVRPHCG